MSKLEGQTAAQLHNSLNRRLRSGFKTGIKKMRGQAQQGRPSKSRPTHDQCMARIVVTTAWNAFGLGQQHSNVSSKTKGDGMMTTMTMGRPAGWLTKVTLLSTALIKNPRNTTLTLLIANVSCAKEQTHNRWVPLNPNMDNPNSQLIWSPMEIVDLSCVNLPAEFEIHLGLFEGVAVFFPIKKEAPVIPSGVHCLSRILARQEPNTGKENWLEFSWIHCNVWPHWGDFLLE